MMNDNDTATGGTERDVASVTERERGEGFGGTNHVNGSGEEPRQPPRDAGGEQSCPYCGSIGVGCWWCHLRSLQSDNSQ
jgi:hypothetical protein